MRAPRYPDEIGDLLSKPTETRGTEVPLPPDAYGTLRGRDQKASWDWLSFAAGLPADPVVPSLPLGGGIVESGRHVLVGGNGRPV